MAEEEALVHREELESLRSSIGRLSSLLSARKAAGKWRQKSKQSDNDGYTEVGEESKSQSSWRSRLGEFLESTPTHVVIVVLLLVDLLATAVDLLLTIHRKNSDLSQCSELLASCTCESGAFNGSSSWEFLHWISIGILCVLMINVLGLLIAFGWSFFKHAGYILDLFVVTTALILEAFFQSDTAGLLIILNLWRIVRVAHGIFEVTDEAWEKEIDEMKERLQSTEDCYNRECGWKDERIRELEKEVKHLKGSKAAF